MAAINRNQLKNQSMARNNKARKHQWKCLEISKWRNNESG
jgi:hypothetical protein